MIADLFDDFMLVIKEFSVQDKAIFIVSFLILIAPEWAWLLASVVVCLFIYRVTSQLLKMRNP
jgi:hypothetical protein